MPFTISVFGDTANFRHRVGREFRFARMLRTSPPSVLERTRADKWFNPAGLRRATGFHVRRRGPNSVYGPGLQILGPCSGAGFPHRRKSELPIPRRGIQLPEQDQPRHAKPFCQHTAVWNHHHGDDAGSRNSVKRKAFVLTEQRGRPSRLASRAPLQVLVGRGRACFEAFVPLVFCFSPVPIVMRGRAWSGLDRILRCSRRMFPVVVATEKAILYEPPHAAAGQLDRLRMIDQAAVMAIQNAQCTRVLCSRLVITRPGRQNLEESLLADSRQAYQRIVIPQSKASGSVGSLHDCQSSR